jgi:hypothetical protein
MFLQRVARNSPVSRQDLNLNPFNYSGAAPADTIMKSVIKRPNGMLPPWKKLEPYLHMADCSYAISRAEFGQFFDDFPFFEFF